jgi:hypothetical protein
MTALSFGSLDPAIRAYAEGAALLTSAGPVSDAFIMSNGARDLLNGPVGSGKTTACIKRALRAAIQTPPMLAERDRDGRPVRRYRVTLYRETYEQLWGTTIKSWQKVLNPDKGIGEWTGASPRSALHKITFKDAFGPVYFEALFRAFGEDADPDDLGGTETTDAYLNEQDKLREDLFINLARSVGRYPSRGEIGLPDHAEIGHGRIFGDCNAPAPDGWVYRDWWSLKKPPGYSLFRQPGGMEPDAENIAAVGRGYYRDMITNNAHRAWWIRIKVHNEPGFNQAAAIVYPKFLDSEMTSREPLQVFPEIPVILACDGGNTPALAALQGMPNGQIRILHEIALERGDELDLARATNAMLALPRFRGCEFHLTGDESLWAGDDTAGGSWMKRFAAAVKLKAHKPTLGNADTEGRHFAFREAMERRVGSGEPGFLVDGVHCLVIRRALNGTFRYHVDRNGEAGRLIKNPDSHVMEAAEYAGGETGQAHGRKRRTERDQALADRRKARAGQERKRYNPINRKRA